MNRTPEPDWKSLPDEILSVDVARLFGIMPKSLSQYVKRGQIDPPVRRESNAAWYRREDVQTFWRRRERTQVQFYTLNDLPAPLSSAAVTAAVSALAGRPDDSLTVTPEELQAVLERGITAGIQAALMPLVTEITALREEMSALRADINRVAAEAEADPTSPPTGWVRRCIDNLRGYMIL